MAHRSAFRNAERFYDSYLKRLGSITVVEIGSQNVNGSIRQYFPAPIKYIGVDFADAAGVDIVLADPYKLPFSDGEIDAIVCSSCLEHSEFFWLTFMEMMRVLKPNGLCFINVPTNGPVHGYPVDCWRFYPDAGRALERWANRQGHDVVLLESYITPQDGGTFNDFIAVYLRDAGEITDHPFRILSRLEQFENGYVFGESGARNVKHIPEDQRTLFTLRRYLNDRLKPI